MQKSDTIQRAAIALLFLGVLGFDSVPTYALPKGGVCKGGVPDGAFTCESNGGTVWCDAQGTYMCCRPNSQGGNDCEQIEAMTSKPLGGFRVPGGKLQMSPGTTSPSSQLPQSGKTTAPIMRRGVEGEQPDTSTANPSGTSPETK